MYLIYNQTTKIGIFIVRHEIMSYSIAKCHNTSVLTIVKHFTLYPIFFPKEPKHEQGYHNGEAYDDPKGIGVS